MEKATGHTRAYILLAGLSLENILKAMLIADDPTLIDAGSLARSLKSHKLMELAAAVLGLSLSEDEQRILRICQDAIPYWGRYPVPLRYNGIKAKEAATSEFREVYRSLHYRLCKAVYETVKDGWDSGVGPKTREVRSTRYGDEVDVKKPFPWAQEDGS